MLSLKFALHIKMNFIGWNVCKLSIQVFSSRSAFMFQFNTQYFIQVLSLKFALHSKTNFIGRNICKLSIQVFSSRSAFVFQFNTQYEVQYGKKKNFKLYDVRVNKQNLENKTLLRFFQHNKLPTQQIYYPFRR